MYGFKLPKDFLIGTANSAFQSEGAIDRDGKSESIMEYFAKKYAGEYSPNIAKKIARRMVVRTVFISYIRISFRKTFTETDSYFYYSAFCRRS